MPGTSSISFIFDRTDNAAFSRFAKGLANRFFAVRLIAPRKRYLDASMRRGLWLFLTSAAGFLVWRPGFRLQHPVARPVPGVSSGVPRRPPRQARRPSRARRISIRRASCCEAESEHRSCRRRGRTFSAARTAANHLTHTGTRIPIYCKDYSGRRGNSGTRRRDELGDRPLADGA